MGKMRHEKDVQKITKLHKRRIPSS